MTRFYKTAETLRKGAKTLPGHYYTSAEIFALEVDRIFSDRWFCVGRGEQIAQTGDYFLAQIGQESLIVLRDRQQQVQAFYNVCRHRGTQLCTESEGHLDGVIRCPYHAWGFALNGELVAAPLMDRVEGFDRADFPLVPVAIAEWEGLLFVNLSAHPIPLETAFAPLLGRFTPWNLPRLRAGHCIEYHLRANWKLIIQNYSECYHCPTVHPELTRMSPAVSSANDLYQGAFLGGPMAIAPHHTSLSVGGQRRHPVVGDLSSEDLQRAYYYLIFPNLLLSLQPEFAMLHRLEPQSANETRIVCEWLFTPEAIATRSFDPSNVVEFWDLVNRQDWQLCESMQKGVSSRAYTPGFYAGQESLLAEIDQEVLKALGHL